MKLGEVVVRIEGGLGNQLFQYATARSLADRLGCELALDLRGLAANGDRPFQLDRYQIRAHVASDELFRILPPPRNSRMGRIKARLSMQWPVICEYPIFWSSSFAYDARFESISHPVYLVGYWQSEKYFAWNRSAILHDLRICGSLALDPVLRHEIDTTESVALHVRRGDYISNPAAAAYHGVCGMDYYEEAVERMKARVSNPLVFVFSDDPTWVGDNLRIDVPFRIIESRGADADLIDFELMSLCQHHILANSSYSWWAAWRCPVPGQFVFAPSRWVQDQGLDTSDVVPKRWELL